MKVKLRDILVASATLNKMPTLKKASTAVLAFTENILEMQRHIDAYSETRKKLFTEHFGKDSVVKQGDSRQISFLEAEEKVLACEVEVNIVTVTLEEMNREENDFAPSDLAAIHWMISNLRSNSASSTTAKKK